ncbi:putative triacylglycerol lipase [Helianthus annuus]|uniref:Putative SGNH hydrolase-type esterase domain-containing protein n=1 Tax=Helianthus annuus TaxID=4232 RepID=A0A251RWP4_HELAN|nr:GDSL esterase/lipase At5g45670 [Helianthus annuus]KAF5760936.1 putative triacylglycerol lipase [Helianthus annuus]KAJ0438876.1 putative triacylglycerol lipase [Helianthus annuus]KAJ0443800.1 putative triacylglycerol lipase [Helianthus annuus]KAJ0461228.1 putative triacylglycerol lipase [Helianthus annuus]KAJ0645535.1 putative triacylglycerol lipase [Helianthus annuus]
MASKLVLLFRFLIIVALMQFQTVITIAQPQVPCYFIFGDSLVDNGNNNRLRTEAKANYSPYGIDFPPGVTGRFTNGLTSADIIGQLLGLTDFIPPFATATNQEIIRGVNYASGAAGIRDDTGRELGDRISLDRQLLNHATIVSRLSLLQRNRTFTNEYLKKCIYTVNMGSNDYINNYLMPEEYIAGRIYTPDRFAELLIRKYSLQLRRLYNLGARKIAVFGLGFLGCTPAEIARFGTNGEPCVESINNATMLFNVRLKPLIDDLNNDLPQGRFTFINVTSISTPEDGVVLPNVPCCQLRSDGQCVPNSIPCPDRNLFIWYDGYHPTQVANTVLANRSYTALSPTDASPYDISRLAQLTV